MPGNPEAKIKRIADLVEWHKEFSTAFDRLLPHIYRFNGETHTGDARRDAWADADRCVVMAGAALVKLEAVLRSDAIQRAKPRGKATYVKVEAEVDEGIGTPMYSDERRGADGRCGVFTARCPTGPG